MPIGGFVINIFPDKKESVLKGIEVFSQVEVHGSDDEGNIVAVIDSESSEEMEGLTKKLQEIDGVLTVGVTYFDAEDELEKIEEGLFSPSFSFGRKGEKP